MGNPENRPSQLSDMARLDLQYVIFIEVNDVHTNTAQLMICTMAPHQQPPKALLKMKPRGRLIIA